MRFLGGMGPGFRRDDGEGALFLRPHIAYNSLSPQ
jgi:hypothetical protein